MYVQKHVCKSSCVQIREQLSIEVSLLPACGTWEFNTGLQPVHNSLYLLKYLPAP